jgi:hypothetical protein
MYAMLMHYYEFTNQLKLQSMRRFSFGVSMSNVASTSFTIAGEYH